MMPRYNVDIYILSDSNMQVPWAQAQYSTFSIRPDRKPPWTVGRDTGRIYLSRATAPIKWNWQMGDPAGPENNHACVPI